MSAGLLTGNVTRQVVDVGPDVAGIIGQSSSCLKTLPHSPQAGRLGKSLVLTVISV